MIKTLEYINYKWIYCEIDDGMINWMKTGKPRFHHIRRVLAVFKDLVFVNVYGSSH